MAPCHSALSRHTKGQRLPVPRHAILTLEREEILQTERQGYLPRKLHQKLLMEHYSSIWKLLNPFWPRRFLIMILRLVLVFHMQLLLQPWDNLVESGYVLNIVPQTPHGWLKDGIVHPRHARRDTLDKSTLQWATDYWLSRSKKQCCFMEVQLLVNCILFFKKNTASLKVYSQHRCR